MLPAAQMNCGERCELVHAFLSPLAVSGFDGAGDCDVGPAAFGAQPAVLVGLDPDAIEQR